MKNVLTQRAIKGWFSKNSKISLRTIKIANNLVNIFYIDCLVNKQLLSQTIIAPLSRLKKIDEKNLSNKMLSHQIDTLKDKKQIVSNILNGCAVVFLENSKTALSINLSGYSTRNISEPPTSQVTKGPREGFVEDLQINVSMLRRRLKSPHFAIESMVVGKQSQTKVAIVYLENIADISLTKQIKQKLEKRNIVTN